MVKRTATALWKGNLKEGKGEFSTASGLVKHVPYTFSTRFGDAAGTNPEELVGAAHAACFSMALSGELGKANVTAESIETTATVTMEKVNEKMTVTSIHLDTRVNAPGAAKGVVEKAAEDAKNGCPISRLLAPGAKISVTAH